MAKRKPSRARSIFYATLALAVCVLPPFLLGNCKLDTTPLWGHRTSLDDEDGGSDE